MHRCTCPPHHRGCSRPRGRVLSGGRRPGSTLLSPYRSSRPGVCQTRGPATDSVGPFAFSCPAVNMSTRPHEFNRERPQCPKPGRLSSRFDCLSARFSFSDLLGFFTFCFFGDLSPTVCSLLSVRRDPRSTVPRCVPQRFDQPLVMFDTKGRSISANSASRDLPPAEPVPEGSTVGRIVKDHGRRLFGGWRTVTCGPPPL